MILDNVKKLCKEKGLNISALEKEAGLGNATVRGWEKSSPNIESLKAVARVLGATIDDLVKEE